MRAGSRPSKTAALVPGSETRAARSSESHCIRCSIQGGTKSSVLSSACSSRCRLTSGPTRRRRRTWRRACSRRGRRRRCVLHAVIRGDAEDLARLDVRAEADEEIGEAVDVLRAVAHGAADYLRAGSDSALAESERARSLKAAASRPRRASMCRCEAQRISGTGGRGVAPEGGRADQGRARARQRRAGAAEHVRAGGRRRRGRRAAGREADPGVCAPEQAGRRGHDRQ